MAYINGREILFSVRMTETFFDKTVRLIAPNSIITASSLTVYPADLIYRSNDFSAEGMTKYIDSKDADEIFFAVTEQRGDMVGFVIDLGSTKYVDIIQAHITNVYYSTKFNIYCEDENGEILFVKQWELNDGTLDVYRFEIKSNARRIRFVQAEGWTKYRFVMKGIEVFSNIVNAEAQLEIKDDKKTEYIELDKWYDAGHEKGYSEGTEAGKDEFWGSTLEYGKRKNFAQAFRGGYTWTGKNFKPTYDIKPTQSASECFSLWWQTGTPKNEYGLDLPKWCKEQGIVIDFSQATNLYSLFNGNGCINYVGVIDTRTSTNNNSMFAYTSQLLGIEKIILKDDGTSPLGSSMFSGAPKIEKIYFEGIIGDSLTMSACPNIIAECAKNIVEHLANYKGTDNEGAKTLKFHADVWARLNATYTPPSEATWEDYVINVLGWGT